MLNLILAPRLVEPIYLDLELVLVECMILHTRREDLPSCTATSSRCETRDSWVLVLVPSGAVVSCCPDRRNCSGITGDAPGTIAP